MARTIQNCKPLLYVDCALGIRKWQLDLILTKGH